VDINYVKHIIVGQVNVVLDILRWRTFVNIVMNIRVE
jgi:hypothetical protein